jgi:hypothetical protein
MMYESTRGRFAIAVVVACMLLPLSASAQSALGVGAGLYFESASLEGVEEVSVRETDQSFDFKNDGHLTAQLKFLRARSESVRVGGGLSYYGIYRGAEVDENGPRDPAVLYEFGPLLELYLQGEWLVPMRDRLDLAIGSQLGGAILFPRGNLKREIDRLQDQNVSVWNVPRPGYFLAPFLGARWAIDERLSARGDLMFKWERMHLFQTTQSVDNTPFRKSWKTTTLRTELQIGLEIAL